MSFICMTLNKLNLYQWLHTQPRFETKAVATQKYTVHSLLSQLSPCGHLVTQHQSFITLTVFCLLWNSIGIFDITTQWIYFLPFSGIAFSDHYMLLLGNCPPTPPLSQHFTLSEKLSVNVGLGRGRSAVSQKRIIIRLFLLCQSYAFYFFCVTIKFSVLFVKIHKPPPRVKQTLD